MESLWNSVPLSQSKLNNFFTNIKNMEIAIKKNNHNEPFVKDINIQIRRYRESRASLLRVKKKKSVWQCKYYYPMTFRVQGLRMNTQEMGPYVSLLPNKLTSLLASGVSKSIVLLYWIIIFASYRSYKASLQVWRYKYLAVKLLTIYLTNFQRLVI